MVVPDGVDVAVNNGTITIKGKNGELPFTYHQKMKVEYDKDARKIVVTRPDDQRESRALHGLTRSLISNMVKASSLPSRSGWKSKAWATTPNSWGTRCG